MEIEYWGKLPYEEAWAKQRAYVRDIQAGEREATLALTEHSPTITLGRGSDVKHLLLTKEGYAARGVTVVEVDRGGDVTYHGPGQLVGYPLLIWPSSAGGVRTYLRAMEAALLQALGCLGLTAACKPPYTGIWVGQAKVAALGVKLHRLPTGGGYVTSHGFALNVALDLQPFEWIVPCGIREYEVTTLAQALDPAPTWAAVEQAIVVAWQEQFASLPPRAY